MKYRIKCTEKNVLLPIQNSSTVLCSGLRLSMYDIFNKSHLKNACLENDICTFLT